MPKLETWQKNLYAIALSQFVGLMGGNLVFPFMPFYVQDLGITDRDQVAFWAGLLATSTGVTLFLFSPVWGALADRFGRKSMLLRAYLGATVTMGLQGAAQNVFQLLALRALQGAFVGTIPAAMALVASSTPERNMPYAMGVLQMAIFTSQTTGPLLGGLLASTVGFRATFVVTAVLFFVAFLIVWVVVKEAFVRPAEGRSQSGPLAGLPLVFRQRGLLLLIGVLFFLHAAPAFVRPVVPLLVEDFGHVADAASLSGAVFAALAVTSALTALLVGRAAGRVGSRNALAVASLGAGLAYLPVLAVGNVGLLIAVMAVIGLFSGGMLPTTNTLIARSAPAGRQGAVFGVAGSAQALAFAVSPLLGGVAASALGIRAGFPMVSAMLVGVGLAVLALVREPRERRAEEPEPAVAG